MNSFGHAHHVYTDRQAESERERNADSRTHTEHTHTRTLALALTHVRAHAYMLRNKVAMLANQPSNNESILVKKKKK